MREGFDPPPAEPPSQPFRSAPQARPPALAGAPQRRPAAQLWRAETEDWAVLKPTSRTADFAGYREAVASRGLIQDKKVTASITTGTAFATASNRHWLTAKHVVDHCAKIVVEGGPSAGNRNLRVVKVKAHPQADVALLVTAEPGPISPSLRIVRRDERAREAFHVGFPQGRPGSAHSAFLGHQGIRRVSLSKKLSRHAQVLSVWAEETRLPDLAGSLGGMSGGVVLDRTGAVIGITSAENRRRGRILTSMPTEIWATIGDLREDFAAPNRRPPLDGLDAQRYGLHARDLIRDAQVARVICQVGGKQKRRRRAIK
jgi:S1-C subfamily serine protease